MYASLFPQTELQTVCEIKEYFFYRNNCIVLIRYTRNFNSHHHLREHKGEFTLASAFNFDRNINIHFPTPDIVCTSSLWICLRTKRFTKAPVCHLLTHLKKGLIYT